MDNILKQGFEKDEFAKMKNRLLLALPAMTYQLRSLTFPQCAYIQSVYTLETLRVRCPSPSFKAVFSYLEDQGIDNPAIVLCLRAIAGKFYCYILSSNYFFLDTVFTEFLNLMAARGPSPAREEEIAEHTQFLLINFCHPVEAVRKAAGKFMRFIYFCNTVHYRSLYFVHGRKIPTSAVEQIVSYYSYGAA